MFWAIICLKVLILVEALCLLATIGWCEANKTLREGVDLFALLPLEKTFIVNIVEFKFSYNSNRYFKTIYK